MRHKRFLALAAFGLRQRAEQRLQISGSVGNNDIQEAFADSVPVIQIAVIPGQSDRPDDRPRRNRKHRHQQEDRSRLCSKA